MNWNLSSLYSDFNSDAFNQDMKELKAYNQTLNDWSKNIEAGTMTHQEVLISYIEYATAVNILSSKLGTFASLTFAADTKNGQAMKALDQVRMYTSEFTRPFTIFKRYLTNLSDSDFEDLMNENDILSTHRYHFLELRSKGSYLLSNNEEVLLSKLKQTGSSAFATLQNKLTSNILVAIETDGEIKNYPLQAARNLAFSGDSALRKKAYEAELDAYTQYEEVSAATLNAIKGEVITETKLRGFDSPLQRTLFDSRMSEKTLNAMLSAMKDSLPVFHQYLKRKGELLGHTSGLPFYDLFAPVGEKNVETIDFEEAKDMVLEYFYGYSDELGDFAKKAFDNSWLDVFPKEGKRGGAFCSNIPAIKESRFLLNFTGHLKNVITMAHELGHGYHGEQIFNETMLNSSYPMPLAETASIFCETIVKKAVLQKAPESEKIAIIEASIQGYTQIIVDIYSRYLFETELFQKRLDSSLTTDELKTMMLNAQKEAYGDVLSDDALHPYMWMNKTHYYSAGRNFYNFPYAFGLLFAKGLYRKYMASGDSFKTKYNSLLRETGKNTIESVAALMDIDVTDKAFWESSLEEIKEEIQQFMSLTDSI